MLHDTDAAEEVAKVAHKDMYEELEAWRVYCDYASALLYNCSQVQTKASSDEGTAGAYSSPPVVAPQEGDDALYLSQVQESTQGMEVVESQVTVTRARRELAYWKSTLQLKKSNPDICPLTEEEIGEKIAALGGELE